MNTLLLLLIVSIPCGDAVNAKVYGRLDARGKWIYEHKAMMIRAVKRTGFSRESWLMFAIQGGYECGFRGNADNNIFGMIGCRFPSEQACCDYRMVLQYRSWYEASTVYLLQHPHLKARDVRQFFLLLCPRYAPNNPTAYADLMVKWWIKYRHLS